GMQLDLGGIAKRYAADQALLVLKKQGLARALVAAGGDIAVGDAPADADAWTVGIAPVEDPESKPKKFLLLTNAAVSTSGDTEQIRGNPSNRRHPWSISRPAAPPYRAAPARTSSSTSAGSGRVARAPCPASPRRRRPVPRPRCGTCPGRSNSCRWPACAPSAARCCAPRATGSCSWPGSTPPR